MVDVSRRRISFTELFNFLVFNCCREKFVQNVFHLQKWFYSPNHLNFWEDSFLLDDNDFTVLQNCLEYLFLSYSRNNLFKFFCKRDNNLGVVMGNAMVLVLHLSKNTAFAIFSQFLVILVKISPTPPRHPVRGTLLKKTNIFHWQFRWQILSKFIIGKSFKVPVVFYSRLQFLRFYLQNSGSYFMKIR